MMGERRVAQEALLYEFSLERHVPALASPLTSDSDPKRTFWTSTSKQPDSDVDPNSRSDDLVCQT